MTDSLFLDDNLCLETRDEDEKEQGGVGKKKQKTYIKCRHCNFIICEANENYKEHLVRHEGNPAEAGPQICPDSTLFIDHKVVFRQYYCPSCYVAISTEVVPVEHVAVQDKELAI